MHDAKTIGSVRWRIANYGIGPALRYLLNEKYFQKNRHNSEISSSNDVIKFFGIDSLKFDKVVKFVKEFEIGLVDLGKINRSGSINNKHIILGIALMRLKPEILIEIGTQHGTSAEFARQFCAKHDINCKILTIDVVQHSLVSSDALFTQLILEKPARKNLKIKLIEISENYERILFFHDSDHTYENMTWEFKTAYRILKPMAIISDDVNLNSSFSDFCNLLNLPFVNFSMGSENPVGAVVLPNRDPDGT